jgi:hypothetical protein
MLANSYGFGEEVVYKLKRSRDWCGSEGARSVRHSRGTVAQRKNQNTILPEPSFHAVLGDDARELRFGLSIQYYEQPVQTYAAQEGQAAERNRSN